MRPHPFDPLSFIFGIVFLTLAAVLSLGGMDLSGSGLRWTGAVLLVAMGLVLLLTSRSTQASETDDDRTDPR